VPSIKTLSQKNASGNYVLSPESPNNPEPVNFNDRPLPGVVVTGLPIRGVFTPNQILDTDFTNTTTGTRTSPNLRSPTFPPQPTSTVEAPAIKFNAETAIAAAQSAGNKAALAVFSGLNMDTIPEGANFGKPKQTALTPLGSVDSTQPGFAAQGGSLPPQVVGTTSTIFSYTANATTSTVVITWSAIMLLYADQTTATVPAGSQTITGVSTGNYFYYVYAPVNNLQVQFAQVSGGVGSPPILYSPQSPTASQVMNGQSVTALAIGNVQVVMPSSGTGGGSGGGSGICVRDNTVVLHREKGPLNLLDCEVGDYVMGRTDWTQIVSKQVIPQNKFVRIVAGNGESIQVTPTHHMTLMRNGQESSIAAKDITLSDFLIVKGGFAVISSLQFLLEQASKIKIVAQPEHEYMAGESCPTILVHNTPPLS
jgi:hypothetical protein